ncbi:hypothetical protein BC629DRAFT_434149 [Irpex lacteus]|nr:hypothetical protein BC629DRAFT_434149 [Irpex lacteus]
MYSLCDPSVTSERDALESRIIMLHKDISRLRFRQNELLPVASLCPEILLHIFEYATPISPTSNSEMWARLHLTHVCRHWREVALAASSFWSTIRYDRKQPKELPQCFLERSRSAQLRIIFDTAIDRMHNSELSALIKVHNRRIYSLCLWDIYESFARAIWTLLNQHPLPLAHFEFFGSLSTMRPGLSSQQFRKLSSLFPSLRTLKVVPDPNRFQSLLFEDWALPSTLTSLAVTYRSGTSESGSSWSAVLEQLRPLCDLRALKLRNLVAPLEHSITDTVISSSKSSLTLPHLRHLTLEGASEGHILLLHSLILPALTQAKVDVLVQGLDDRTINILLQAVFSPLRQTFTPASTPGSQVVTFQQTVDIEYRTPSCLKLSFIWSTNTLSERDYMEPKLPSMKLLFLHPVHSSLGITMRQPSSADECRADMQRYFDELYTQGISGLGDIKMFIFDGPDGTKKHGVILPKTIRSMPELRVLCFHYLSLALDEIKSAFTPLSDGSHPFPRLHTLQFGGLKVTTQLLTDLATIFGARQSAGMRPLRLIFVACKSHLPMASFAELLGPMVDVQFYDRYGYFVPPALLALVDGMNSDSDESDDDGDDGHIGEHNPFVPMQWTLVEPEGDEESSGEDSEGDVEGDFHEYMEPNDSETF